MRSQVDRIKKLIQETEYEAALAEVNRVSNIRIPDADVAEIAVLSARHDQADILSMLFSHGFPTDHVFKNRTPLQVACLGGFARSLGVLIASGGNVNRPTFKGDSPLLLAIKNFGSTATEREYIDCVILLLDAGAKCDVKDDLSRTPLSYACEKNLLEICELLLQHGASPNFSENEFDVPLSNAVVRGNMRIVELLLENGANPNASWVCRTTPLHLAAAFGRKEVAQQLLKHGADKLKRTLDGETPVSVCERENNTELAKLISEYAE